MPKPGDDEVQDWQDISFRMSVQKWDLRWSKSVDVEASKISKMIDDGRSKMLALGFCVIMARSQPDALGCILWRPHRTDQRSCLRCLWCLRCLQCLQRPEMCLFIHSITIITYNYYFFVWKLVLTRRRMARERRGAESSVASMETLYYKIIYYRCIIGRREE